MDLQGDPQPTQFSPLVGHLDLSIRKTLRRVLGLFTAMILKSVSESITFIATNSQRVSLKIEKRWQIL